MELPKWIHLLFFGKQYRLVKHLLFWLFIYSDEFLSLFGVTESFEESLWQWGLAILSDMFMVYINLYVLIPRFLIKGKVLTYIALTLLLLLLNSFLGFCIYNWEEFQISEYASIYLVSGLIGNAGVLFMAVAMKLLQLSYNSSLKIQELKQTNLKTELAYLKTQVNPHFLFNTLNNMFVMSKKKEETLPDTILQLSDLLRYQLYECDADLVPLEKEVAYLKNYIELEQLRRNNLEVHLELLGDWKDKKIRPLILLPFIENAFKYSKASKGKEFIEIKIDATAEILFSCKNNKGVLQQSDVGGIGLTNATRRLELAYPDQHVLSIEDKADLFEVQIKIDS